ncbi:hypothetical protein [Pseudolabrys taiwanensis]|uniref:hypothetical protein n=1 Tax=Pseudolabrys taiwanensis TaxID=331696 RepID=UPI0013B45011|nr:hypothetical protein [Pseudolabrys taiwanensis]
MRAFEVKVDGYSPIIFGAETAAKARWRAFSQYSSVYVCSFRRFLSISKVRPVPMPEGVDPKRLLLGVAQL